MGVPGPVVIVGVQVLGEIILRLIERMWPKKAPGAAKVKRGREKLQQKLKEKKEE